MNKEEWEEILVILRATLKEVNLIKIVGFMEDQGKLSEVETKKHILDLMDGQ